MLHISNDSLPRPKNWLVITVTLLASVGHLATLGAQSLRETPVVLAYRAASPSVVNIHGQKMVRKTAAGFAGATTDALRQVNGMGTGVIVDPRGYIVTNHHVVEDVPNIRVTLADERTLTARLIAFSKNDDLAVIKINSDAPLPIIKRGSSEDLMIGEPVLAIGNAFGYEHTLTQGIISALHRDVPVNETQKYRDLIQTSAGINPGNSGGPLLNIEGEMIGINVAVRVGAQQIAFTIPVDQAMQTVTTFLEEHNQRQASLGIEELFDPQEKTLEVRRSDSTHFVNGDRVIRVGQHDTRTRFDLALAALEVRPGDSIPLVIERQGETKEFKIVAGDPAGNRKRTRSAAEVAWEWIGIRTEPINASAMRQINLRQGTTYRGGLRITAVRSGSPAATYGIEPGDVLLGLHEWRTESIADLEMVIDRPELRTSVETKFYIHRRDKTLYGFLRLAELPASSGR